MYVLTCLLKIAKLALSSIRVDTTPLFGSKSLPTPKSPEAAPQPSQRKSSGDTMFDMLDEVLVSPVPARESDD